MLKPTSIDCRAVLPAEKTSYVFTWTPTQVELDQCIEELKLYVCLTRVELTTSEFLVKYQLKPSTQCVVFFIPKKLSDEMAEASVSAQLDVMQDIYAGSFLNAIKEIG